MVFFVSVLLACFKCFSCFVLILQMFHLDISKVYGVADSVFQMHISYVSSTFRCMLHILYPDISKVDRVLHPCLCFSASSPSPCVSSSSFRHRLVICCLSSFFSRCWLSHLSGCVHVREQRRRYKRGLPKKQSRQYGWVRAVCGGT